MESYKVSQAVTPAKAGVYNELKTLDPRLRGDAETAHSETFFDTIIYRTRHKTPCSTASIFC